MALHEFTSEVPLIQILPMPIKRRVNALKKLQFESLNIESKFFTDLFKLECQYHPYFKNLYDKREKIVTGSLEPSDEDAEFEITSEDTDEIDSDLVKELREKLAATKLLDAGSPGIPEFWLTIFRNVEILNEMIQPHDEPILKHLTDVQVVISEDKMGFLLKFIFSPNPYFTNTCLTKEYEMKCTPETNDPWSFEGPEIFKCQGCTIDWNKNMNVTVKTIRKRQKHKSKGAVRTVVKSIQNDSFFNFFKPPNVPDEGEMDEETQALLTCDFEIGHYIKDKIIPRAVLYYTGEALDDDDFDEGDESSEESDDENDDDDDEDEEDEDVSEGGSENEGSPRIEKSGQTKNKNKRKFNFQNNKNKSGQQPQECAQQ